MSYSNIQSFNHPVFGEIQVFINEIGNVEFAATETAEKLGYSNPQKAINDHCKEAGVTIRSVSYPSGTKHKKFITEGNLYRLIVRSNLPQAEKFESWVFDEILPSIRKHGIYATDDVIDKIVENPDFGIEILTNLKEERRKNETLKLQNAQKEQIIKELQPKATYYDLVLQNKSLLSMSKISKDYGMSAQAMNSMLHQLGVQYKQGDCWLLYQKYADKGYTQSKTHVIDDERSKLNMYWTQKGRLFIYELLKNKMNLLPLMERERIS